MNDARSLLPDAVELRPTTGKVLTVALAVFAVFALVAFALRGEGGDTIRFSVLAVAGVYGCWQLFWFPSVAVDPAGVTVKNPFRTVHVSWPAVVRVDTRYALTLFTKNDKVTAWSAPAPTRYAAINTTRTEVRGVEDRADDRGVRLGDIPRSESGLAALHVRRAWTTLRDAGYLDSGVIEGTGVTRTWNTRVLLIGSALLVAGLALAILL